VIINQTGPYDFLVDTGTQFTMIDRSLADELRLKSQGSAKLVGVGFATDASFAMVDALEVGTHVIKSEDVELVSLEKHESASLRIRGILGGHSLRQFDVLIDYTHSLLCLDDTRTMQTSAKGAHVEQATPVGSRSGLVIVPVRLSSSGSRQLRLALDSGTNVPLLFDPDMDRSPELLRGVSVSRRGEDGVTREFLVLRFQHMLIGSLNLEQISFVMPEKSVGSVLEASMGGLLPTALFRSIFISYPDSFVILDPR
jgi:hypothetical protein